MRGSVRESDVVRTVEQVCRAKITDLGPAYLLEGSDAPTNERSITVVILDADWKDHRAPLRGFTLTESTNVYPSMRAERAVKNANGWTLHCRTTEDAEVSL